MQIQLKARIQALYVHKWSENTYSNSTKKILSENVVFFLLIYEFAVQQFHKHVHVQIVHVITFSVSHSLIYNILNMLGAHLTVSV